jgi:hypothetical protein
VKYWFRQQLDDAGFDTTSDFAWENRNFDSSNKTIWYRERFTVADEGINGNESNVKEALIWYDVMTKAGDGDDQADNSAAAIAELFEPINNKDVEIGAGLKISIDEATTGSPGDFEETEWQTPVRIRFRIYDTDLDVIAFQPGENYILWR